MARYCVTGGAGFIGSHLTEKLVDQGHEVVVIDNMSTGKFENMTSFIDRIEFVENSITDLTTVKKCCEGVDCIFHQAALASVPRSVDDPITSNDHNINGTLNIFWAAKELGIKRVVYAASSSIYGDTEVLPKHEGMQPKPQSPYAVTKHVSELYGSVFNRIYGVSAIGLRYFNVYGARQDPQSQYAAVVPLFITRFLEGKAPQIHGDGMQSRDFTYINNVVDANLAAAAARDEAGGLSFNVACGDRITIKDLCHKIRDLTGAKVEPEHVETRVGDVRHSQADISLATELLDYTPAVDLDQGLKITVDWYKENTV